MLHKNCAARDPHAQCSLGFGDAYLILSLAGRRFAGSSAIRARTPGTNPRGHGLRTVGDSLVSRGVPTAVAEGTTCMVASTLGVLRLRTWLAACSTSCALVTTSNEEAPAAPKTAARDLTR